MIGEFLDSRAGRLFLRAEAFLLGGAAVSVLFPPGQPWRFAPLVAGAMAAGSTVSSWLVRSAGAERHGHVVAAILGVVGSVWPIFLVTVLSVRVGPLAGFALLAVAAAVAALLLSRWNALRPIVPVPPLAHDRRRPRHV